MNTPGSVSSRTPRPVGSDASLRPRFAHVRAFPMRLSFVIPTRNQARFLGKCIDSCLAQGIGSEAEVIVADGASTDGTRDVLRSYGERITWFSEPDAGQSDAVNKGVRRARGEV